MNHQIEPSVRVAYSRAFLRSFSLFTGRAPFARGIVVALVREGEMCLAQVKWDDGLIYRVEVNNLVREDQLHLELT
jgi:hypothetical protein